MDTEKHSQAQGCQTQTPAAHEHSDAGAALIFGFFLALFILGLLMHWFVTGYFNHLKHKPTPADQWQFTARPPRTEPGAFPRLQVSPPADLDAFRAREEAELHGYGWINATAGIVHVPIERAMEMVLKQGLPARTGTNQDQPGPSSYQLEQQRSSQPGRGTK